MIFERLMSVATILSFKKIALVFFTLSLVGFYAQKTHSNPVSNGLIEERNFQQLAQIMQQKKLPLLLEFHADHCPYCRQLEEDFLAPMAASSEYDDKIIIRQLQVGLEDEIIDFQGKKVIAGDFSRRYNAFMTPTMIFVDSYGIEVAEKIVGINTPSLFGGYIDIEIEKALTRVRAKNSLAKREVLHKKD